MKKTLDESAIRKKFKLNQLLGIYFHGNSPNNVLVGTYFYVSNLTVIFQRLEVWMISSHQAHFIIKVMEEQKWDLVPLITPINDHSEPKDSSVQSTHSKTQPPNRQ